MFYMDTHRIGPNSIGGAPIESIFAESLFEQPFKRDPFKPEAQGRSSWLQQTQYQQVTNYQPNFATPQYQVRPSHGMPFAMADQSMQF